MKNLLPLVLILGLIAPSCKDLTLLQIQGQALSCFSLEEETIRIVSNEIKKQPESVQFFKEAAEEMEAMIVFDTIKIRDIKDMIYDRIEETEGLNKKSLKIAIENVFAKYGKKAQQYTGDCREELEEIQCGMMIAFKKCRNRNFFLTD